MSAFFSNLFILLLSKISKMLDLHCVVKFQLRKLVCALTWYENAVPQLRNCVELQLHEKVQFINLCQRFYQFMSLFYSSFVTKYIENNRTSVYWYITPKQASSAYTACLWTKEQKTQFVLKRVEIIRNLNKLNYSWNEIGRLKMKKWSTIFVAEVRKWRR